MENESKIDDDITAKYEKEFIRKLKVWHSVELKNRGFEIQQIDQKAMKYNKKRHLNLTVVGNKGL